MSKKIVTLLLSAFIMGSLFWSCTQPKNNQQKAADKGSVSFLELAQTRYTTKVYDATKKLSEDQINQLTEILRLAPSSINSQPWQFVIIADQNLKSSLAEVSLGNASKVKGASHLVVFRGAKNLEKLEAQMKEYLSEGSLAFYTGRVKNDEEGVRQWIGRQVYISLGFFLAACADMGIDSTPMEGIDTAGYDKILNLGDDYQTLCVVAIGYRSPEDSNQPSITPKKRLSKEQVIKMM